MKKKVVYIIMHRTQERHPWFLYLMVAQFPICTNGVNQAFQFVKGIGYIERVLKFDFFSEKTYFA